MCSEFFDRLVDVLYFGGRLQHILPHAGTSRGFLRNFGINFDTRLEQF